MLDYTILSFPHSGLLAAAVDEFCAAVFDGGKWASCVERKKGKREGGRGVEETIERAAARPEKDIDELLSCQADMERLSVYLTIVCLTTRSARENQDSRMSHACRFTHSHIHKRRMQAGRV